MPQPSRIALGSIQPEADHFPILWGLLDLWRRQGLHVQPFRSHAELASSPGAEVAAGRSYRHLDCGMLFPRLCGHLLQHGSRGCKVAVVDGTFHAADTEIPGTKPDLAILCDWLDLAAVVVVDVSLLQGGHLPERPKRVDAVILDAVSSPAEAARWSIEVETLWGVPVAGWMETAPALRAVVDHLAADARPSDTLCSALGACLEKNLRLEKLMRSVQRNQLPAVGDPLFHEPTAVGPRIAVGLDAAMSRYFPENLELLSSRGAELNIFAPLRDAEIPAGTELIYLGDGCLHAYAHQLASNFCWMSSLRSHVADGGRIYAEGMGTACLGRELILPHGERIPMAGVLPWSYRLLDTNHASHRESSHLTALSVDSENWFARGCGRLRGYAGCSCLAVVDPEAGGDALYDTTPGVRVWGTTVASTIPLFFPGHPRLVSNLIQPRREAVCEAPV